MDKRQNGQGIVEFALMLPILMLLLLGIVNFAYFFTVHTSLVSAAREGVRYGMVDPTNIGEICDRVTGQGFLSAPDPANITLSYEEIDEEDGTTVNTASTTCADQDSSVLSFALFPEDQMAVKIEHNLPAFTPLIRASFNIEILAERTITRVRDGGA